ncbi:MAG: phytase, partial [Planctomycetota bacterium]|nr:phytase [Planctomycetota bacterium]
MTRCTIALLCAVGIQTTLRSPAHAEPFVVEPVVETDPVESDGDAADDAAVWVHPTDPARSLIIATDNRQGLGVYSLDGARLQVVADGRLNNVDLRCGFPMGDGEIDLIAAGDFAANTLNLYRIADDRRSIVAIAPPIPTGMQGVYGLCMHRSPDGEFFVFITDLSGAVQQRRITADASTGAIRADLVRTLHVGG